MENTIRINAKKPNGLVTAIDNFFHISERKSTIRSEIGAGMAGFLVACCCFIMNAGIIGKAYGNYAGSYLAVSLLAFLGTLVLGFLTNRPLIQCSNLALSSALVSMISAYSGLTYSNMMMITFLGAIINLVLVLTPLGKKAMDLLPSSVKKAMPIAVGLLVMIESLQYAGLFDGSHFAQVGEFSLQGMYVILAFVSILAFVVLKVLNARKVPFRVFGCMIGLMWAFGILFFMDEFIGGQTATTLVYQRLNLFFNTDGASPYNIVLGFKSVDWGCCFTKGFDFSGLIAQGGSPALAIFKGIFVFLGLSVATNVSQTKAVAASGRFLDADLSFAEEKKVYAVTAVTNVIAPIFGAPIQTVSHSSTLLTDDEAKTGLSSLVASLGFFVTMFTWIIFAFVATETHGVGMWIESSEVKLAAYVQDIFAISCLIVALSSASMFRGIKDIQLKDASEVIPFLLTIIGAVVLRDIAFGIALSIISDFIFKLIKKEDNKTGSLIFSVLSLCYLVFSII